MIYKPEHLVVDTTAFIQNAPLQEMGNNIVTIQEVVNEIKSKRQLKRLVVLPYDLAVKTVFPENIRFVTEFSKKTGDYPSLSATDIKLIALAYQMERELVGSEHLRSAPAYERVVSAAPPLLPNADQPGFYKGDAEDDDAISEGSDSIDELDEDEKQVEIVDSSEKEEHVDDDEKEVEKIIDSCEEKEHVGEQSLSTDTVEHSLVKDLSALDISEILKPVTEDEVVNEEGEEEEAGDADDSEWITPANVKRIKQQMNFGLSEDKPVTVACITTDFAMQNVLKQIGLNILGLDGRVIKHIRTYIFRCYACFKTTSDMTKVFCPKCGHKTLKRVAVSVDENGQQKIHINFRRPLTSRGKKFSLPKPQGGKHANNPILCGDQPMPDQRPTRLGRTKTNALDDDYIAGFSPFVMRDVNSKSAMLGIRGVRNHQVKYWMKRNPNEVMKKKK